MPKLLETSDKSHKIETDDGRQVVVGRTPETDVMVGAFASPPPDPEEEEEAAPSMAAGAPPAEAAVVVPPKVPTGASGTWDAPAPLVGPPASAMSPSVVPPTPAENGGGSPSLGMVESSKTTSTSLSPKAITSLNKADEATANAIRAKAEAEQSGFQALQKEAALQDLALQKKFEDEQAREMARQDALNKKMSELDAIQKKYADAKIDPKHLWGDEGTGNRFAAALGIVLGAVGSGLNGQKNSALEIVESAIQRDIEIQKANIDNMGKQADMARGGLSDLRAALGDERAAAAAEESRQLGIFERRLERVKLSNASKESKANAEAQRAEVQQKRALLDAEVGRSVKETTRQAAEVKPMDMLGEERGELLFSAETLVNELGDLEEMYIESSGKGTGPISGRLGKIADSLGIAEGEPAAIRAAIRSAISTKLKALSGAGASDKEREFVGNQLMAVEDNPEAFLSKLRAERKRINNVVDGRRLQYEKLKRVPNDTRRGPNPIQEKKIGQ